MVAKNKDYFLRFVSKWLDSIKNKLFLTMNPLFWTTTKNKIIFGDKPFIFGGIIHLVKISYFRRQTRYFWRQLSLSKNKLFSAVNPLISSC
jgi:hypothetical protein